TAVDLQIVHGQPPQDPDAGETRAEVVQREAKAQLLQAVHEGQRFLQVIDGGRFGHFEHDAPRVDAGGFQLLPDEVDQGQIGQGAAGDVDVQGDVGVVQFAPVSQQLKRLADDPPIQLADEAAALAGGQEFAGHDELSGGA